MGLDVALVHGLRVEFPFDDDVGFGETLLDVADLVLDVSGDVALDAGVVAASEALHAEIGGHVVVEQGRAFGHGVAPGEHGGQDLVVHLHQLHGLQRDVGVGGADGGDSVADIQDLVLGQQVFGDHAGITLDFGEVDHPVLDDGEIGGRGNGDDAGERFRLAGVDAADAGVAMRAAQHTGVEHSGQVDVGAVAGCAGNLVDAVVSHRSGADDAVSLFGLGGGGHGVPPGDGSGGRTGLCAI